MISSLVLKVVLIYGSLANLASNIKRILANK